MNNYDKALKEMTPDRMAELLNASDECTGSHMDANFECRLPRDISCRQCLKTWLMQEVKQNKEEEDCNV